MRYPAPSIRAAALLLVATVAAAQSNWTTIHHDDGGQRHSTLSQINTRNVSRLAPAWTFTLDESAVTGQGEANIPGSKTAPPKSAMVESIPLVVNGVMFVSWPYCHVAALKADTGKKLWDFTAMPCSYRGNLSSMRSVAYWPGDGKLPPRLFFGTEDGQLWSLHAKTGQPVHEFGEDGIVNLKTPEVMNGHMTMHYGMSSPPFIYKNSVITGSHIVDETGSKGPAGDVRAWDARTGKLKWTFHTVPRPGEPGHETWLDDSWQNASGANVWTFFTADVRRGILYMPVGSLNNDYYGVDRPGQDLFANSLVAVDAETGKLKWHFQIIHHDLWDYDLPVTPMLFDIKHGSERIPAVAAMAKNAILFILNRETGKPVYGVEERKVPSGHLAGEWYSPTQPFPLKPAPLARQTFTEHDFARITPEHEAACRAWYGNFLKRGGTPNTGPYTPPSPEGALRFPATGGGSWAWGGTFDPKLGYYIVNTTDSGGPVFIWPDQDGIGAGDYKDSPMLYNRRPPPSLRAQSGFSLSSLSFTANGMPCWSPPWGRLTAIDVNTGDIAWQIPYGVTPGVPPGINPGGPNSFGGPTSTAGGLFFIAGSRDSDLRAYDSATGRELWSYKLKQTPSDVPMTYADGKGTQFVAIAAGNQVVAFRLSGQPQTAKRGEIDAIRTHPVMDARAIFERTCTTCHSSKVVTSHRRSHEEWTQVLERMALLGAAASEVEFATILRYLESDSGLDSKALQK